MERIEAKGKKKDKKGGEKRKMSESVSEQQEKKERTSEDKEQIDSELGEEEEEEEVEIDVIEEEEIPSRKEEGKCLKKLRRKGAAYYELERFSSEEGGSDSPELEVIGQKVVTPRRRVVEVEPYQEVRFPERVQEAYVRRDSKGREGVLLAQGEVKEVARRINEGAHSVKKVIRFWKTQEPVLLVTQVMSEEKVGRDVEKERYMMHMVSMSIGNPVARDRIIESILELETVAADFMEGDVQKVAELVSEQMMGSENFKAEERKLTEILLGKEGEIEEKEGKIQELEKKLKEMEKQLKEKRKKEDELRIKLRTKEKEIQKMKAETKNEPNSKPETQVTELVNKLFATQQKQISDMTKQLQTVESKVRVLEKPTALILQIAQASLAIPARLKNVGLDAWGELEGTGVQAINEWAKNGWCAVATLPECEARGIQITVDGSKTFRAGRTRIRLRLEYRPKENQSELAVGVPGNTEEFSNVGHILFPEFKGMGPPHALKVRISQWKEI
jgi:hypothetical protein